jgi:hypothetical protein
MTFEQYQKADTLMKKYAPLLMSIQNIRNEYIEDVKISEQLTDFYFKLKENFDKQLKEI